MEEDTPFIDPDWLPNGSFPDSTSKKLFIYFMEESEDDDEIMHLIHHLELISRVYVGKQYCKEFPERESAKEISGILDAAKILSQKLANAHQDTLKKIRVDAHSLAIEIYSAPLQRHQMNKFDGMEIDLKHTIYAIEHGKECEMTMEYESNRTQHQEDHDFVCEVKGALKGFLKMPATKAQIHKTISIILDKKDALKNQINYPLSFGNRYLFFKVRKHRKNLLKTRDVTQAQKSKALAQAQIHKIVKAILKKIADSKKGHELSKKP